MMSTAFQHKMPLAGASVAADAQVCSPIQKDDEVTS
jgi:hypothetical protein